MREHELGVEEPCDVRTHLGHVLQAPMTKGVESHDYGGGEPPIIRATTTGRISVVRDYLVAGADADRPDSAGRTARHIWRDQRHNFST